MTPFNNAKQVYEQGFACKRTLSTLDNYSEI